jgi:hypothetical protein
MAAKPNSRNWNDIQIVIAAVSMALTLGLWNLFAGPDREVALQRAQTPPSIEPPAAPTITQPAAPAGGILLLGGSAPQTTVIVQNGGGNNNNASGGGTGGS